MIIGTKRIPFFCIFRIVFAAMSIGQSAIRLHEMQSQDSMHWPEVFKTVFEISFFAAQTLLILIYHRVSGNLSLFSRQFFLVIPGKWTVSLKSKSKMSYAHSSDRRLIVKVLTAFRHHLLQIMFFGLPSCYYALFSGPSCIYFMWKMKNKLKPSVMA